MYEDNISDLNSATIVITQTVFDKRALATNDLTALAISLSNMYYLSLHFPCKLSQLLLTNGSLELLIRKTRQLSNIHNKLKAEISFSSALACLASAAAAGGSRIICRMVQARLVDILLPVLHSACLILDQVHRKSEDFETPPEFLQATLHTPTTTHKPTDPQSFLDDSFHDLSQRQVRVHDLLMITKIVAYISKYEATRILLRDRYPLFYMLEHLCTPVVVPEIRQWAGTSMRNATKPSSHPRCGLITCSVPISTLSCPLCDVGYCSEACREFAAQGHGNWCMGGK